MFFLGNEIDHLALEMLCSKESFENSHKAIGEWCDRFTKELIRR
ncbi:MAG: hypothetical protein QXL94_03840 [Candidatus Parvarchaeum sp.]